MVEDVEVFALDCPCHDVLDEFLDDQCSEFFLDDAVHDLGCSDWTSWCSSRSDALWWCCRCSVWVSLCSWLDEFADVKGLVVGCLSMPISVVLMLSVDWDVALDVFDVDFYQWFWLMLAADVSWASSTPSSDVKPLDVREFVGESACWRCIVTFLLDLWWCL